MSQRKYIEQIPSAFLWGSQKWGYKNGAKILLLSFNVLTNIFSVLKTLSNCWLHESSFNNLDGFVITSALPECAFKNEFFKPQWKNELQLNQGKLMSKDIFTNFSIFAKNETSFDELSDDKRHEIRKIYSDFHRFGTCNVIRYNVPVQNIDHLLSIIMFPIIPTQN